MGRRARRGEAEAEAGVGNKRRREEGRTDGRAARGGEERRPVGRDERDAARGGAERMHGGCRLGASGRRWIGPVGGGGFDRDTEPAREGLAVGERTRDRPRRGSVGRHGAG